MSQVSHKGRADLWFPFHEVSVTRVFLVSTGWDASPSLGYLPALNLPVSIYTPGERHYESKLSCP